MGSQEQIKAEIVRIGKFMYEKGFIAASDGNISVRLDDNKIVITRSGVCKGRMSADDLLVVNLDGAVIEGEGQPSSEYRMHSLIYSERKDVNAVVHAHPPLLTAFTLAGIEFESAWLPEVWLSIGSVVTAPYALPTTNEVPESIRPYVKKHNAILLERHGIVTYSLSLESAYNMLEKLEHAAIVAVYTQILSGNLPRPLTPIQLEQLNSLLRPKK